MTMRGMVASLVLANLLSGCTIAAIVGTKHIPIEETSVGSRPTSRRADLNGTSCYAERNQRVTSRIEIENRAIFAGLGLLELLIGVTFAADGSKNDDAAKLGGGSAMVVDSVLAFGYMFLRHGKVVTRERWVQSMETTTCPF